MDLYAVEHYLYLLKNDEVLQRQLAQDPRAHLAAQALEPHVREAIVRKDFEALWQMGVHPLLLVPLSRFLGVPPAEYRARLRPFAGQRKFRSAYTQEQT